MPSFRAATSAALLFAASAQQLSPWPTTPAVHAPGPITAAATSLPSFPGAVGFGSSATGGRGGAVVRVTTLADAGPGSFRDAVSAPNRTVVFDVGGYIDLASAVLVASDITIAAQTAPGGGIGLSGRELSLSGASNVIVRGLRVRQGSRDVRAAHLEQALAKVFPSVSAADARTYSTLQRSLRTRRSHLPADASGGSSNNNANAGRDQGGPDPAAAPASSS